jgi:hypothetical protein
VAVALTNSKFGDDYRAVLAGIVAAIRAAWPDVIKVYADRNLIEDPNTPRAVVVPGDIDMISGGSDPRSSGIKTILQVFPFSIFLVERITQDMDVIERKVSRADALIDQLMADVQFLGVYELPQVTAVKMAEEEPDPKVMILQIDFNVQCLNWKHGAA